ncbi:double zinc ribbon domain-containing protein [Natronococcus wangiae]|uniref:double zinc ribbon domain-containing protein n=1 Tax=Natronococcus wangiae TaxID=3068275 RepID=UPI00273F6E21|nr:zinc ribbon domain-containing protein [Natronococcus sp. AD5]
MSKITFRADDDLVAQLEELDASKSEVMREALRAFLADEGQSASTERTTETAIDDLVRERVDDLLTERLGDRRAGGRRQPASQPQDVNVTISLEGEQVRSGGQPDARVTATEPDPDQGQRRTSRQETERDTACVQCGERVDAEHVYCPNCGEKASRRLFCDCGDEVRSDWSFCPSCGRRTPAADVLDSGQPK